MNKFQKVFGPVVAVGAMLLVESAHAVYTVPQEVLDAKDSVLALGLAVFGIMVGIKIYKWLKRAL